MNRVLMKFFNLPPGARMLLAVAGFGSLASIIYFVLPSLRTKEARIWLLIVGGIVLVLALAVWGIRRMISGKKTSSMNKDLESQGPTRGDIAEQEQIYREKFRAKLGELKQNGLSVYKMPWFVLMGEPGCGKTASLIHSGLDFPLGKDEVPGFGGTRNYNWWFTNEAVILDTAGRIAFQEEGTTDKVEWEYFLKLLGRNRPRCPLNGVIIAIPADKLLRDSAEERQQKASVLRERLRQIHQHLGVRFPTFLLVTKMDLVGGFSEFFEEIRVDLQQRNQMFGWSRPGEFQESYDPSGFPKTFDEVYFRLRDWGMRYLQRKATDEELGMVVTFPESFRQIREPLNDYVATVFQKSPLLEPPFFRGFYFTSAVQEGAPIFDVFARRQSGVTVAERPTRAVDSKAFFIHDFYARKVFPEHGLVFRSARHVTLNKRMRRVVWGGSIALGVLLIAFFVFGWLGVRDLVKRPREDCVRAGAMLTEPDARPTYEKLPDNLLLAQKLAGYAEAYNQPMAGLYARMLFIGANIDKPRRDVETIHARFVLDAVFRPIVEQVEQKLAATDLTAGGMTEPQRQTYMNALETYARWYGEVVGETELKPMGEAEVQERTDELRKLMTILDLGEQTQQDAATQVKLALGQLRDGERAFPRDILVRAAHFDRKQATQTLQAAVERITSFRKPFTEIQADAQGLGFGYWIKLIERLTALQERYAQIVVGLSGDFSAVRGATSGGDVGERYAAAAQRLKEMTEDLDRLGDYRYSASPDTFVKAYNDVVEFVSENEVPQKDKRILRLKDVRQLLIGLWSEDYNRIEKAIEKGAPNHAADPQQQVYAAIDAGRRQLEQLLDHNLNKAYEKLATAGGINPLDLEYYQGTGLFDIREQQPGTVFEPEKASLRMSSKALGPDQLLRRYLQDLRGMVISDAATQEKLGNLAEWPALLGAVGQDASAGTVVGEWLEGAQRRIDEKGARIIDEQRVQIVTETSRLAEEPVWRPTDLFGLANSIVVASEQSLRKNRMAEMVRRARATIQEPSLPGVAQLVPGFRDELPDQLPFTRNPYNDAAAPAAQPVRRTLDAAPKPQEEPEVDEFGRRRRPTEPEPAPQPDQTQAQPDLRISEKSLLLRYHTRDYLKKALVTYLTARDEIAKIPGSDELTGALDAAAQAYARQYFLDWHAVYSNWGKVLDPGVIALLADCNQGKIDWPAFHQRLADDRGALAENSAERFKALLHEVVLIPEAFPPDDKVSDRAWSLIVPELQKLNDRQQSLVHSLSKLRDAANAMPPGQAEVQFTRAMIAAWETYVEQVRALGPQATDGTTPPEAAAVRTNILADRTSRPEDFALTAPFVDLADYGQQLLGHHLDAKLAAVFSSANNSFPVVSDAHDSSASYGGLAGMGKLPPARFIDLLRSVKKFNDEFGPLYGNVQRDARVGQTISKCQAWVRFLYADPGQLAGSNPRPLPVGIGLVDSREEGTQAAGSVYNTFSVQLPVLNSNGSPAQALQVSTRAGEQQFDLKKSVPDAIAEQAKKFGEFSWDLMSADSVSYPAPSAEVTDRHEFADAGYPEPAKAGWALRGDPWTLLLLIGASEQNDIGNGFWRIPVRINPSGKAPISYQIGVRLGSPDRPYPGPIPPLASPGALPRMAAAGRYLSGLAGGAGTAGSQ